MEITLSIVIHVVLCVTFATAADDLKTDSDINFKLPVSEDVKQYISKVVSTMAEKHSSDIQVLQERIRSQEKRIDSLESEKRLHSSAIRDLKRQISNVDIEIHIRSCECDKLSDKRNTTKKTQTKDSSYIQEDKSLNQTIDQESHKNYRRRTRRSSVESKVAFFATMSTSLEHLGINQDIVFDHVVTNIGEAYNVNHGTFIAPVAGTYVFSVTLAYYSDTTDGTWGFVVVKRAVVATLYVHYEQSSQTVVVNLQAGDDVSIQNAVNDKQLYGGNHSTLSGFLLYEDVSDGVVVG